MDIIDIILSRNQNKSGSSGGGIPTVEISTALATDGITTLTAEENAKLDEAAKDGSPCVIKGLIAGTIPMNAVYSYGENGAIIFYSFAVGATQYVFKKQEGVWTFSLVT